jgi:hypothetical protein
MRRGTSGEVQLIADAVQGRHPTSAHCRPHPGGCGQPRQRVQYDGDRTGDEHSSTNHGGTAVPTEPGGSLGAAVPAADSQGRGDHGELLGHCWANGGIRRARGNPGTAVATGDSQGRGHGDPGGSRGIAATQYNGGVANGAQHRRDRSTNGDRRTTGIAGQAGTQHQGGTGIAVPAGITGCGTRDSRAGER